MTIQNPKIYKKETYIVCTRLRRNKRFPSVLLSNIEDFLSLKLIFLAYGLWLDGFHHPIYLCQ